MKLVAGSYERFVWGWEPQFESGGLLQSFCRPAHLGPIKCAAAWGGDLVTGGSDDTIHVFDLRSSKDVGSLPAHKGAVTSLQFFASDAASPKATHLFSGSEDGTISIWDADSWIHLKTMKGKAPINDISVHPSGKLGVSVERDRGFRMWNLMKGRCSFRTRLPYEATLTQFNGAGDLYAMCWGPCVDIHNAEDMKVLHSLKHDKAVLCMNFEDNLLYTAGENCGINAWDFRSGKPGLAMTGCHSRRVKGLAILKPNSVGSLFVASASSDGFVKIWDIRMVQDVPEPRPLMEADTKARLTCIVVSARGGKDVTRTQEKRKRSSTPAQVEDEEEVFHQAR